MIMIIMITAMTIYGLRGNLDHTAIDKRAYDKETKS
jgi:hypothetical protein